MTVAVDVRDLLGHPGASRSVHVAEQIAGLDTEVATVPEDRPVAADLLFESVVEGLLISGPLEGTMALTCARCLKPIDSPFRIDVQELFVPGAEAVDDEYPVADGMVDLEPMMRDAILLAMPLAPLCRPDCLGLCERCGGDRNQGECHCPPESDPRWSALLAIDVPEGPLEWRRDRTDLQRG